MTRINLIQPEQLCDQHLLAEFRELTRIPNTIVLNGFNSNSLKHIPQQYTLGKGHVLFFTDKIKYLYDRYQLLYNECANRGFNTINIFPSISLFTPQQFRSFIPTDKEIATNVERIIQRIPKAGPRFYSIRITPEEYIQKLRRIYHGN